MRYEISHRTSYAYRQPVAQSHHIMHLEPRLTPRQTLVSHNVLIQPAPVTQSRIVDTFGNNTAMLRIDEPHTEFIVHARSTVELQPAVFVDLEATVPWEQTTSRAIAPDGLRDLDVLQLIYRTKQTPIGPEIAEFARVSFWPGRPVLAGAMALTRRIFEEFEFDPTATDISTPVAQVLAKRRGVCQDFAHLSLAALRALGVPARYVSGYLLTRPPPGQQKLKGVDASHAWIAVWAPETGWVDFDPTNGVIPSLDHITIAWGRDYDDICPVSGVLLGGGAQTMSVAVDVDQVP